MRASSCSVLVCDYYTFIVKRLELVHVNKMYVCTGLGTAGTTSTVALGCAATKRGLKNSRGIKQRQILRRAVLFDCGFFVLAEH